MKKLPALLIIITALTLGGCCNSIKCDIAFTPFIVNYHNYTTAEADSLMVSRYNQGVLQSTIYIDGDTIPKGVVSFYPGEPDAGSSFVLKLIPDGRTDTISDFKWMEGRCGNCKKNAYYYLDGYTHKGVQYKGATVELFK